MRKIIILLNIFLVIFLGCRDKYDEEYFRETKEWVNRTKMYDSLVVEQTLIDKRIDDIFLNFSFGDSKTEVDKKLKKMLQEGKLEISYRDEYQYELSLDPYNVIGKGLTTFTFHFANGELYKMELLIHGYDLSDYEEEDFYDTVLRIYKDKYDNKWYELSYPGAIMLEHKMIKNNLEIIITKIVDGLVTVEYVDKIAEQNMETHKLGATEYSPKVKSNKSLDDL